MRPNGEMWSKDCIADCDIEITAQEKKTKAAKNLQVCHAWSEHDITALACLWYSEFIGQL